jgi:hypothetical protein
MSWEMQEVKFIDESEYSERNSAPVRW